MEWLMTWIIIGVIGGLVIASCLILRNDISYLRSAMDARMDTRISSIEHYIASKGDT